MSMAGFTKPLSGSDKFQLLIDRHIRLNQQSGNIIRLSIELKEKIDFEKLKREVEKNWFLTELNSMIIENRFLSVPVWKKGKQLNKVKVNEQVVESYDFSSGFSLFQDIKINSGNLIHIDVFNTKINTIVVVSAHHALVDNQGIQYIAKVISGIIKPEHSVFEFEDTNAQSFIDQLIQTLKATLFVFRKTPPKLSKLTSSISDNATKIIRYSEEDTKAIEENASKNGALLSKSSFYLAAVSMAFKQTVFANKGENFFLPVPLNQRLRGNEQAITGNHLSFLFYSIPFSKLNNLKEATLCITEQMMQQVKEHAPKSYSSLLRSFRFLPLGVYDFFFKMPSKGAVCSFLFSDLGETLAGIETFMDKEIKEVLNFPPNPCPPHVTLVVMKNNNAFKIIITYNKNVISEAEITKFENAVTALLTK